VIAKFEGAYHGWLDSVIHSVHPSLGAEATEVAQKKTAVGSGIPDNAYKDFIILPWNNVEMLEKTITQSKDRIAGILVDPCMCNSGVIPPDEGFLETIRELTKKNNIVLIFDEVITGFRLGLQSAQGKYGITPDLTTMAKAVGGGFPVAVYGGKAEIMDLLDDGSVFRAGTLNANRVAMAAAHATLEFLEENNGNVYNEIYRVGEMLINGMKDLIEREKIQAIIQGYGPMFQIHFTSLDKIRTYTDFCSVSQDLYTTFRNKLLPHGVFIRPSHFGEIYISAAHNDEDIEKTLDAMEKVVKEMKEEKLL
jgi:glutamate-1-semialdehyde 2,1-aminomutase